MDKPINVLFLCTHNSARSILAEALLNHIGGGRLRAYSAGSSPRENQQPNPMAIEVLREAGVDTEGLSSKNWDAFGREDAPKMDLVITVCDNAAGEACPYWPGHPATAHWGYADPSEVQGSEADRREAFKRTRDAILGRLRLLVSVPPEKLSKMSIQQAARELASR